MERSLGGGGRDELLLDLPAGQYLHLEIDQEGLDVKATLLAPSGETVLAVDGPGGTQQPELMSLVTTVSGVHRLIVMPHDPGGGSGSYKVKLVKLRPAKRDDGDLITAQATLREASHLRVSGQEDVGRRALARAEQAQALARKVGDPALEIEADLEIGFAYQLLRNGPEAISWFEEALKTSLTHDDPAGRFRALRNLGAMHADSDPEKASGYFKEALVIATGLGDLAQQADSLQWLGRCQDNLGRSAEALESYRSALTFAQSIKNRRLEGTILNAMTAVYTTRGESREALSCIDQALKLAEEQGFKDLEAAVLTNRGLLQRRRGEPIAALVSLETALGINRSRGDLASEARVLIHLGTVYQELGDLDRALDRYREALGILSSLQAEKRWEAIATFNIGRVYLRLGDAEAALAQFESARQKSREAENRRNEATALHGLGVAWLQLGQAAEAIGLLEEALALRRQIEDRPGEASTLLELGNAHQKRGDAEKAGALLRAAQGLARQVEASFVEASALLSLARLGRDHGDLEGALREIDKALFILESIRSELADDSLSSSFFASKRSYYELKVDLLMRLQGVSPGRGFAKLAFEASEMARSRSLLDLLAEGRIDVKQGISPELERQEAEVEAQLAQIQREIMEKLSRNQTNEASLAELRQRLEETEEERQEIERRVRQEHPRYAQVRYSSPLGLEDIQGQLDEREALLEYSLGADGSYLFVVTRKALEVHPLPDAGEIAKKVEQARKGVEGSNSGVFGRSRLAAYWLYKELIAPARAAIAGKRLLIAPDGALHYLSFEALLTEDVTRRNVPMKDLPFLLLDFAVTYVPSASVLSSLQAASPQTLAGDGVPKRFVAFADPIYASEALTQENGSGGLGGGPAPERAVSAGKDLWPRLVGSEREVASIAELYPPPEVRIYRRDEATEENFKGNRVVEEARWLHIATHGQPDEKRPELSGLFLTHAKDSQEDSMLRVYEIFNLSLKADLVVLSACETALGKEVSGEGLVGMTRAFLYAGAPSVVVSLWRVADVTTPELMVSFYGNLGRLGKAEALRQAKLTMIREGGRAHPYYWAPFILVGKAE